MSLRLLFRRGPAPLIVLWLCSSACTDPASAQLNEGNRLAAKGKFVEAAAAYQKSAEATPDRAATWALLGNARWSAGQTEPAKEAWNKALELEPAQVDAAIGLARFELSQGRPVEAIALLNRALQTAPARAELRTLRAAALLSRGLEGDAHQAVEDSEVAVRAHPNQLEALFVRASALIADKDYEGARTSLELLERVHPGSPFAPYGLARLASAEGRKDAVRVHLEAARQRSKTAWDSKGAGADPAFAWLSNDPDLLRIIGASP
jgi:tetratricopeptide (TPR) repeat protein